MSAMPERITVMKAVTYNVEDIIKQIIEDRDGQVMYDRHGGHPIGVASSVVTLDDVLGVIEDWADEDLAGEGFVMTDEDGEEL